MVWKPWEVACVLVLAGCSRGKSAPQEAPPLASAPPAPAPEEAPPATWPAKAATPFVPMEGLLTEGEGRSGSALALATAQGRKLALVADEDRRMLILIDREKQLILSATPLAGSPSQLLVRQQDGRVYVALRDRNTVAAFEAPEDLSSPLQLRGELATATEPVGLALSADEATLLVTAGWGHQLAGFSLDSRSEVFSVNLPREPRAMVVSKGKAFVSHMVGSRLSVVDLQTENSAVRVVRNIPTEGKDLVVHRRPHHFEGDPMLMNGIDIAETRRSSIQGYALALVSEQIYAPSVLVDPGDIKVPTGGSYGQTGVPFPPEVPDIAVVDRGSEKLAFASVLVQSQAAPRPCLLPRAAVGREATPQHPTVLVACQGIDAVIEYNGKAIDPARAELRRWEVPAGPTALALDPAAEELFVWSQFDRALGHFSLKKANKQAKSGGAAKAGEGSGVARLAMPSGEAPGGLSDEAQLGRTLFHTSSSPKISGDGRACASCHPDGRDDALTWSSPEGPRNTPMLAGRLQGTEPFSWKGSHPTIKVHMKHTITRLTGKGLNDEEFQAIEAYLVSMPVPTRVVPVLSEQVARGRQIFRSGEAMCSLCHGEHAPFTDKVAHDVKSGQTLDTPSLLFVGGTGPYFHDGRFPTMRDLLRDKGDKMGHTSHLSPPQLDDLEAYLDTL